MWSLVAWCELMATGTVIYYLFRFHILPAWFAAYTQLRFESFGLLTYSGVEFRSKKRKDDIIPLGRAEKVHWTWGNGDRKDESWVVFRGESCIFHLSAPKEPATEHVEEKTPKVKVSHARSTRTDLCSRPLASPT